MAYIYLLDPKSDTFDPIFFLYGSNFIFKVKLQLKFFLILLPEVDFLIELIMINEDNGYKLTIINSL